MRFFCVYPVDLSFHKLIVWMWEKRTVIENKKSIALIEFERQYQNTIIPCREIKLKNSPIKWLTKLINLNLNHDLEFTNNQIVFYSIVSLMSACVNWSDVSYHMCSFCFAEKKHWFGNGKSIELKIVSFSNHNTHRTAYSPN